MNLAEIEERLSGIESMLPALEATLITMQYEDLEIGSKTTEVDLVTKADLHSEQTLLEFIRSHFSGDRILSEESGEDATLSKSDFYWVIDPIDGTVNYANRLPSWSISIGLLYRGQVVGGIVTAPALRERFRSILGKGATLNGRSIRVNAKPALVNGLVVTGFPYDRAKRAEPLSRAIANMLEASGGVRRLGSAALDLCYLADGRFVGYYEMSLQPWDSAAGVLIATEAGARITDIQGTPYDIFKSRAIAASNGLVHDTLLEAARPMLEAIAVS